MKTVSIVGFGRFGKVLYRLLRHDFIISLYSRSGICAKKNKLTKNTRVVTNIKDIYKSNTVFFCVPIRAFESVIQQHKKYFKKHHLLIDVLSVKIHAQKVFERHLKNLETQAILTHPMFGPDSSKHGFRELPIVMDRFRANHKTYAFWHNFFIKKGLRVVEYSPKKHDKLVASSQGVTHFIGRCLKEFKFKKTPIDTLGAQKLIDVMQQTCNDTWELFFDLQNYNPYTKSMRTKLGKAYDTLYNTLLPIKANTQYTTIGIQGGRGSFNEEAVYFYIQSSKITNYKIVYLYTTQNVLSALKEGIIDIGQFAVYNSAAGIVQETIQAMSQYKFHIIKQFALRISHTLMIRSDAHLSDITTIMTHPQVLAQCKKTLKQKYPQLKLTSGNGKLIDHALIAKKISNRELPKNIATIGGKIMAKIYNLKIIEENLQDSNSNYTSFMIVKR